MPPAKPRRTAASLLAAAVLAAGMVAALVLLFAATVGRAPHGDRAASRFARLGMVPGAWNEGWNGWALGMDPARPPPSPSPSPSAASAAHGTSLAAYCIAVLDVDIVPSVVSLVETLRPSGSLLVVQVFADVPDDTARFMLRALRTFALGHQRVVVQRVPRRSVMDPVTADIMCIRTALEEPSWRYVVRLSADTFPLVDNAAIQTHLRDAEPTSFIDIVGNFSGNIPWREHLASTTMHCLTDACTEVEGAPSGSMVYFGLPTFQLHRSLCAHLVNTSQDEWEAAFVQTRRPAVAYLPTVVMHAAKTFPVQQRSLTYSTQTLPDVTAQVLGPADLPPANASFLFAKRFAAPPCFLAHVHCDLTPPVLFEPGEA